MKSNKFRLWLALGIGGFVVLAGAFFLKPAIRLFQVMNLFGKDNVAYNFSHMNEIFDTEPIVKTGTPLLLPEEPKALPVSYNHKGKLRSVSHFLKETDTLGLLIIKDGKIVHESYANGYDANTKTISWSLSKSFVSCLFGIAMKEGYIRDLNLNVEDYLPALKGTGYEGVPVIDVMQMSSGIRFDETYSKSDSDINRMGRVLALNTSIDEFVASLTKELPPGKKLHYVSMDTQVLAMILRETLKKSGIEFNRYFTDKLWNKLHPESDAYWVIDSRGMELAFGGLNATVRDYAKFGLLYLNEGELAGEQVVPREWVRISTSAGKPHLLPGTEPAKSSLGYGYQWWLPFNNDGDFTALGIYGQFIYIYPKYKTVIVKVSSYKNYNIDGAEKLAETIDLFKQITKSLK